MRTLIAALVVASACSFFAPNTQAQSVLNLTGTWVGTDTSVFLQDGKKTKNVITYRGPLYFQIQDNDQLNVLLGSGLLGSAAAQYKCVVQSISSPTGMGFLTCALCGSSDFGGGNTFAEVLGGFVTKSNTITLTGAFGTNAFPNSQGAQITMRMKRLDTVPPMGFVDCSAP